MIEPIKKLFLGIFANCVDWKFSGFPPIPQKNAEWMGHRDLH